MTTCSNAADADGLFEAGDFVAAFGDDLLGDEPLVAGVGDGDIRSPVSSKR